MRFVLAAALAVGLTGCGSTDFFGDSYPSAPAPSPQVSDTTGMQPAPAPPLQAGDATSAPEQQPQASPAAVQTTAAVPDPHCSNLAKQRAVDSAYEGEDPDTQRAVYDRSYSECLAWDAKHRS
jgi:hypothetical protein